MRHGSRSRTVVLALVGLLAVGVVTVLLRWMPTVELEPATGSPRPERARTPEVVLAPDAHDGSSSAQVATRPAPPAPAPPEARPAPAVAPPDGAPAPGQEGRLRVQVRSRETGATLPDVRVTLTRTDSAWGTDAELELVTDTDPDGWAEFRPPLGVPLQAVVFAWHRNPSDPLDGRLAGTGHGDVQVRALTSSEPVEVVLEVATEPLRVLGRAVSADTGEPVPGARVAFTELPSAWVLREGAFERKCAVLAHVQVDAQGYFEHRWPPWQSGLFEITAPGHGLTTLEPVAGSGTPATTLEARLERAGTLEVTVSGAGGEPLALAELTVQAPGYRLTSTPNPRSLSYRNVVWTALTGKDGRCTLVDLPSAVPLELRCAPLRGPRLDHPTIQLEPGELRAVIFDLGGDALRGRVETKSGRPAQVEVWLLSKAPTFEGSFHPQDAQLARSTRTNAQGEFEFESVVDGTWWVGLAPGGEHAPTAKAVQVAGSAGREVVLEAEAGLDVGGVVLDPDGQPVEGVSVWAKGSSVRAGGRSDASGRFRLGGFPAGAVEVGASRGPEGLARPESVQVLAGADDVVLRLRSGAEIRGRLVDARTGAPLAGEVWCQRVEGGMWMRPARDSGQFVFPGLEAGSYHVVGTTADGRVGVAEVAALAGGESATVELRGRQGATVTLRHKGSVPRLSYQLRAGEITLRSGALEPGGEERRVVPAGALQVECPGDAPGGPWVRELLLAPGEERVVVLRGAD